MIQVLVLLEVKNSSLFKEFETHAIEIMEKYGGKVVNTFEPNKDVSSNRRVDEIHILEFPSLDSFMNYRADNTLNRLEELRKKAILNTTIYVSS